MKAPTIKVRTRKPWYASRVLWLNAIAVALLAAEAQLKLLEGVLPGTVYQWAAFALPVFNAVLRLRNLSTRAEP